MIIPLAISILKRKTTMHRLPPQIIQLNNVHESFPRHRVPPDQIGYIFHIIFNYDLAQLHRPLFLDLLHYRLCPPSLRLDITPQSPIDLGLIPWVEL